MGRKRGAHESMTTNDVRLHPKGCSNDNVIRLLDRSRPSEEADAVDFLRGSGLPLSCVILGLLDQSDDCIKILSVDGALSYMNCNGRRAMQIDDFGPLCGQAWHLLWPEASQDIVATSVARAAGGEQVRFEAECPTAKGEPRWWEVTVSPLRSPSGAIAAILSTSRDVTERHRREEALETIAMEMRHRLRNAHAVGAALLMASGQSAPEHLDFARAVAARLGRLSEVHAKLVDTGNGLPLRTLCQDVQGVFEQSGGDFAFEVGSDLHLDEERARTLSLLLGELTTNSLKYGALGQSGAVEMRTRSEDGMLTIEWDERFTPGDEATATVSSGQGQALMARMLRLCRGTIEAGPTPTGYRAMIGLPV